MNLFSAVTTVGGFTMLSRFFGFVRDILIAAVLGAGPVADAFFVAFKFPNLFRRMFAEGAFAAAFVPIFASRLESSGKDAAQLFAEQALTILLAALLIMTVIAEVAMPWIMHILAPGFLTDPEKFAMTVLFARITFPYLLFISIVSLCSGVLNSLGRFAAAAATPILLNLCLIGAILFLAPILPTPGLALAWGVAGAGVIQLIWIFVMLAREGYYLRLRVPRFTEDIRSLFRRALPVAIGAGVYQINLVIDMIIASMLPSGSISYLFYADRVNQLPLGVIGIAIGTALLPMLSRQIQAGDSAGAIRSQNKALEVALLLTLPAAAGLFVLSEPIISVLFQRGNFGANEVVATSAALSIYALGLPAYVLIKSLSPGFFARKDTKTPVQISIAAIIVNVVLALILMGPFLHVGLAIAMTASAWMNALLLAYVLQKRGNLLINSSTKSRSIRAGLSSLIMASILHYCANFASGPLGGGIIDRSIALAALVSGGVIVYGVLLQLTGVARVTDLESLLQSDD